ncbi:hypothetical protein JMJ35_010685 [Cladonia borealis]|uniref:Uncharacterized protein n=1 Tax=Cladonia borealis TaxID=184061 RepID=A0AA39V5V9_9LECA|nr:hypothetical protein JMJ35_010685 [Cladonia borealis]
MNDRTKLKPFKKRIEESWNEIQSTKKTQYGYDFIASRIEKDHVLEVQHIVEMLTRARLVHETRWANLPLATIVHLAYYLNDQRNLWSIPKAFNQAKAYIPLYCWYGNHRPSYKIPSKMTKSVEDWEILQYQLAAEYLFAFCTSDGRTPFTQLLSLAAEMASLEENTMTWLTVKAGEEILKMIESWEGQVIGIKGGDLRSVKEAYSGNMDRLPKAFTQIKQQASERAKKGLAVFATDVADGATMVQTIATQTEDPATDLNPQIPQKEGGLLKKTNNKMLVEDKQPNSMGNNAAKSNTGQAKKQEELMFIQGKRLNLTGDKKQEGVPNKTDNRMGLEDEKPNPMGNNNSKSNKRYVNKQEEPISIQEDGVLDKMDNRMGLEDEKPNPKGNNNSKSNIRNTKKQPQSKFNKSSIEEQKPVPTDDEETGIYEKTIKKKPIKGKPSSKLPPLGNIRYPS